MAVKNRKIIGSGHNNCSTNNNQKKGHNPESGTCTTSREGSKNHYFQNFCGKYFYGTKRKLDLGSGVVRIPSLSKQEESLGCYPVVKQSL